VSEQQQISTWNNVSESLIFAETEVPVAEIKLREKREK